MTIRFYDPQLKNGRLANFARSRVLTSAGSASSAEHAYQCIKFFNTRVILVKILAASSPAAAKAMAATYIRQRFSGWARVKVGCMQLVTWARARDDLEFRSSLLRTGYRTIFEWTELDRFWGRDRNGGCNWMGKILMSVRGSLRASRACSLWTSSDLTVGDRIYLRRVASWLRLTSVTLTSVGLRR